jgi:hypothetical protein
MRTFTQPKSWIEPFGALGTNAQYMIDNQARHRRDEIVTNADVFVQILSEASGRPPNLVRVLLDELCQTMGAKHRLNAELPTERAEQLLSDLRKELPGIRAWLAEGNRLARIDLKNQAEQN